MNTRRSSHEQIARNIRDHGYHVYVVSGGPTPRWVYTIGFSPIIGYELVFAGGAIYTKDTVLQILRNAADKLMSDKQQLLRSTPDLDGFYGGPVCSEWARQLLLGAHDYYQESIRALQILPKEACRTIDVPDLSLPLVLDQTTPWQWLKKPWPYKVSPHAEVMTDIKVLMGSPVVEVARWEEQYWEAFAGPSDDVSEEDAFLVSLGTLLGADPTLGPIAELGIGMAMRRSVADGDWEVWASDR